MSLNFDPQTLRAFVAVARHGNVSRAAERLHLSQPAVSLQLKGLAANTGLTLFTRTPQGLTLTRDGAALLPQAEKALAALADFAQAALGLHSSVRGTLRIGTILDPEFTRLGAFLKELVEAAPQIDTELRQGMSGNVLAQIVRGDLDVGFYLDRPEKSEANQGFVQDGRAQAAIDFEVMELTRFTYRVIAPAGWGQQVQGRDWKALAALPWLATPPASVHHRLLSRVFGAASLTGLEPRRVALVDQEASMLDLVKSGVGLSLARDSIAIRESQAHGLVVADRVSLDCVLSFICLKARVAEPVVASAWGALAQAWR
ncbi:LysR family transcriptional regulator [Polaromonas naphthalenivorans]|uniref:Transcriptional regulator, LysR family n=1 Tax=Polaromonas naphthalenivorans (strain CJ2) TaxID=365044 RepID=A1VIM8_POLNA|nr:LysR family transcriptional regulator [Polaromonas naphthalenivorans]ABM35506.1 transcriptional regulator, LysR family [Polaromonas naphthalenivorans CJ2]